MELADKKTSNSTIPCPHFLEVIFAFVLFAIIALPFYKQIPNNFISTRDEFKHLLIAQSLTNKESLHPEALRGIQYPPGWGVIIGSLLIIFGNQLQPIHAMTTVLAWLTGPLVYIYLRKQTEAILALAIGGFTSAHFLTITLGNTLLSEPIFGVAWLLCLLLLHLSMKSHWHNWILTGIFVALCMSFRTIGISLWIGAIFYLAINSKNNFRIKLLHIFCLSIIPILYFLFLNIFHPSMRISTDAGYGAQFLNVGGTHSNEMVVGVIKRTVKYIPLHTRDLIKAMIPIKVGFGTQIGRLCLFTAISIVILAIFGWVRRIWRTPTPAEYSFACYIGICYLWPYTGIRFFWPVVPLIAFYAITNFTDTKFYKRRFVFSTAILVSIIIMTTMISLSKNLSSYSTYRLKKAEQTNAIKGAVVEAARLSATPIIATISFYKIMYYFPNLGVCRLRYTTNKESHQKRISKCGATFLFYEVQHKHYFDLLLKSGNSNYQLVFNKAGVYLWRIQD
jgi:4-amino-4-deoxy-L-arabinose transferase-like glycosyltransferase